MNKVSICRNAVLCALLAVGAGSSLGSAQSNYKVLGWDKNHIALVNASGAVEWEYPNEANSMHDIQSLPNGNVLFHNGTTVREVNRDKKVVWEYISKPKEGYSG